MIHEEIGATVKGLEKKMRVWTLGLIWPWK